VKFNWFHSKITFKHKPRKQMSKTSNFFKTTTILSTALLLSLLAGCLADNPIDYTTGAVAASPSDSNPAGENNNILDVTAPTASVLLIDNGAASTNTTAVALDFDATDDVAVTDYYASESAATPQASDSGWESYQQSTSFTLSGSSSLGVFPRTVYVWFKDAAGNVSESVDASISLGVYDTTAPTAVSVVIDNGTDNTTSSSVTLTLLATDDQAVTNYYASESAVTPQAGDSGWDNYSTSVSYSFDNATAGTKTVNVWFKDAAGNVSEIYENQIELVRYVIAGSIAAGDNTCIIKNDNTVQCWGKNDKGQSNVPADLGQVSSIEGGGYHTCAVKVDGTARCWGDNGDGQSTIPSNLGPVTSISAGAYHTCAVKVDKTAQCWGWNFYGQSNVPSDLGQVSSIIAGGTHTCAIKSDATARCWGRNWYGESNVPNDLGLVKSIAANSYNTCAIKVDGGVRCFGGNGSGQNDVPADLGSAEIISSSGESHCVILTDSGNTRCWGRNNYGQSEPPSDLGTVSSIASGRWHACAIKSNGGVQCWGYNAEGRSTVPADFQ
jgi:hypothetical protein